jgi:hypothetical protein
MRSQLASLCLSLRDLAAPVRRHFNSPEAMEFLFNRYGWITILDEPAFDHAREVIKLLPSLEQFLEDADEFEQLSEEDPDGGDIDALLESAIALATGLASFEVASLAGQPAPLDAPEFWASIGEHLLDDLLEEYLRVHQPGLFLVLRIWAAFRYEPTVPDGPFRRPYTRIRLDRDQLIAMVKGPLPALQQAYHWGDSTQPFDHVAALAAIAAALQAVGVPTRPITPIVQQRPAPPQGQDGRVKDDTFGLRAVLLRGVSGLEQPQYQVGFDVYPAVAGNQQRPSGLLVRPLLQGAEGNAIPLGDYSMRWGVASELGDAVGFTLFPGKVDIIGGEPAIGTFLEIVGARDQPWYLIGNARTPRIEFRGFVLGLSFSGSSSDPEIVLRAAAVAPDGQAACRIVIPLDDADAFVQEAVQRDSLTLDFAAEVRWSSRTGLSFNGRPTVEIDLPMSIPLGPVTLRDATLAVVEGSAAGGAGSLAFQAAVDVHGAFGPVDFVVEQLGFALSIAPQGGGTVEIGSFGVSFGFKTPRGIGLAVDAGPVQGGGLVRFDPANGRYGGVLSIRLSDIAVQAVALLDTRLPGGQRGFSLLVMLSARFFPGIHLAFGVTLTGVGGLVGVNRRIDVDALNERYASGTAGRLLAAEDPLRDLPALLTELSAVFPPAEGLFVVGPTLQLQWAKLVTLDVGVFLEFPGPTRVVVLGTARASVDNPLAEGPLLRLRCDFVGVLDLAHSTFSLDAVLIDSRLLESFPVTGGLMVRASWGAEPYVLFSAGGFHPDFAPGSLVLPKTLTRLAMSSGSPDDELFLRFEGYFAITPNTVQFGASVEVVAKLDSLGVRGFFGFDALIRFEPFYFQISFEASMRVQWRGRTLAGITVKGTLSGPGPVKFTGRACIEVLFFDICASASFELGSDAPPTVSPVSSAVGIIADELRNPVNLRAVADDPAVTLRTLPVSTSPILPATGIVWEQTRAPLGLLLERFEGSPLRRTETVEVIGDAVSGEARDWFAPGSFAELSDAEALTRRSFERLQSGVRLAAGDDHVSEGRPHRVEVKEFRVPAPAPVPQLGLAPLDAPSWLMEAAQVREGRSDGRPPFPAFTVDFEPWHVVDLEGRPIATTSEAQAHQHARAVRGAVAIPAGDVIPVPDM